MADDDKKGIEIRNNSMRIVFYYKGVKCAETLDLENTPANLKVAKQMREDVLSDIRRNQFRYRQHFPNSKRALLFDVKSKSYLMRDLLLDLADEYKKSNKLAVNTIRDYCRYINNELIPTFGRYYIHEITPLMIRDWIVNSNQSAKYVANLIIPLRAVLNDAKNFQMIAENPLDRLSLERLYQKLESKTDYEVLPFKIKEIDKILSNCRGQIRNLIQFGFYSGLRIGEIIALKWDCVDIDSGKIIVKHTMVDGNLEDPKTKSSLRELVLTKKAFNAIVAQLEYKASDDDFVFKNPNTDSYFINTDAFRKHWVKIFSKLDIKYRNPYQMRHTFASMMLSKGFNMFRVSKYLGHNDTEMVIKIYGSYIPVNESDENNFGEDFDNVE